MFGLAWSEVLLIGAVALIAIGPKDLPVAIKAVTGAIKKARRLAAEFQTHVDELVREADLGSVKDSFKELADFDVTGTVEKAVDPDGSLKAAFAGDILGGEGGSADTAAVPVASETLPEAAKPPQIEGVPPFIPPEIASAPKPPPFIPPGILLPG
jgi:sec-independent protein translocase protein TatB